MKKEFNDELTPEIREKMKKNLVYIGIFSVVMMFAGFTSAYLVMMGDSFWLKFPLPWGFYVSTALIALSSLTFILALRNVKKGNIKGLKMFMIATVLLGFLFVYFQFKGYGQLMDRGIHPVNNHLIVTDGRYGDYYEIKFKDAFVEVDGNHYLWKGKDLSVNDMKDMQNFMAQFLDLSETQPFKISSYGKPFVLYFENTELTLQNEHLIKKNGEELVYTDRLRLRDLAINVRDSRGDFFARGEIGKDFNIYFKGKPLEYDNRTLKFGGKKLSSYLQLKATETSDTASSFLYIITFLHLLHILVAIIYLIRVTIYSFSGRYTSSDYLGLKSGAIFWHFLGLLWLYLLLFLLFIH